VSVFPNVEIFEIERHVQFGVDNVNHIEQFDHVVTRTNKRSNGRRSI